MAGDPALWYHYPWMFFPYQYQPILYTNPQKYCDNVDKIMGREAKLEELLVEVTKLLDIETVTFETCTRIRDLCKELNNETA